jgi:competence protein ComEA
MEILKKYKYIAGVLGIAASLFIYQIYQNSQQVVPATLTNEEANPLLTGESVQEDEPDPAAAEESSTVIVDVKGEVKSPGVYEMNAGERFHHVIERAGGLTESADAGQINLAQLLEDGMVVYLPKEGEAEGGMIQQPPLTGTEKTDAKVNLNKATSEELQTLNGIGPAKAEAILSYREEAGGFKAIEDILNVSGIGDKSFEKLKDSISVK